MIHVKIGLFNTFTLIFIQLMMHVKIRFFNTFILIFYLAYDAYKNWSLWYIYTHFLFKLWYMQKLACLKPLHSFFVFHNYASLNATTKWINCNNNFNSHCKSLSVSCCLATVLKKISKSSYPSSLNLTTVFPTEVLFCIPHPSRRKNS